MFWLQSTQNVLIISGMKLRDYIQEHGDGRCAELFGVEVRTIESWRRGEREPRTTKAVEIAKKTDGAVSFVECYAEAAA